MEILLICGKDDSRVAFAKEALESLKLPYRVLYLDELAVGDPCLKFSSPSILVGPTLAIGQRNQLGWGSTVGNLTAESIRARILETLN